MLSEGELDRANDCNKNTPPSWAWWFMHVILQQEELQQADAEFQASLGYIVVIDQPRLSKWQDTALKNRK